MEEESAGNNNADRKPVAPVVEEEGTSAPIPDRVSSLYLLKTCFFLSSHF